MNFKKNFKTGIFTLLPIIAFIWIVKWMVNIIIGISDFLLVVPQKIYIPNEEIPFYWHIIGISSLILILFGIGYLMNHYYVGKTIKKISQPLIQKTPILNSLFRISKQAGDTLTNKKSFEDIVLVEFPVPGVYSMGFITGTDTGIFEEVIGKEVSIVFIPTTPNPTNGFLVMAEKEKIRKLPAETKASTEFLMSMGTVELKKKK